MEQGNLEIFKDSIKPFQIKQTDDRNAWLHARVIVRIRACQGHSATWIPKSFGEPGALPEPAGDAKRIGQHRVEPRDFPVLLMHSTLLAQVESIRTFWLATRRLGRHKRRQFLCSRR
jgi:hypothetical protein